MDECPGGEMWGDGGGQARTFVQEQSDDLEVCILDRLDERGIAIVILRVQVRDEGRYASIRGNRRTSRLQVDLGAVAQELRDSVEITLRARRPESRNHCGQTGEHRTRYFWGWGGTRRTLRAGRGAVGTPWTRRRRTRRWWTEDRCEGRVRWWPSRCLELASVAAVENQQKMREHASVIPRRASGHPRDALRSS